MLCQSWAGCMVPFVLEFAQSDRQPQCTFVYAEKNEECGLARLTFLIYGYCPLVSSFFLLGVPVSVCSGSHWGNEIVITICFLFIALRMRRISS